MTKPEIEHRQTVTHTLNTKCGTRCPFMYKKDGTKKCNLTLNKCWWQDHHSICPLQAHGEIIVRWGWY